MDAHADDLRCLLDELELPAATIVGLSMGGYVAFALWRRHRERVRALVLADTRSGSDSEEARAKRRDTIAAAEESGARAVADRMVDSMLGKSTRAASPRFGEDLRGMIERQPVPGIVAALEAMMARPDSTELLDNIGVPTLVIVGEEDVITPASEARAMASRIPRSTVVEIPRAGHLSNLEQPEAFNDALLAFLRTC